MWKTIVQQKAGNLCTSPESLLLERLMQSSRQVLVFKRRIRSLKLIRSAMPMETVLRCPSRHCFRATAHTLRVGSIDGPPAYVSISETRLAFASRPRKRRLQETPLFAPPTTTTLPYPRVSSFDREEKRALIGAKRLTRRDLRAAPTPQEQFELAN